MSTLCHMPLVLSNVVGFPRIHDQSGIGADSHLSFWVTFAHSMYSVDRASVILLRRSILQCFSSPYTLPSVPCGTALAGTWEDRYGNDV